MKASLQFSAFSLPVIAASQTKCPCFNKDDLKLFTNDNIIQTQSCSDSSDIGIFQLVETAQEERKATEISPNSVAESPIQKVAYLPQLDVFGFAVNFDEGHENKYSSCLLEGDDKMGITKEEAIICSDLIKERCAEIGLPSHKRK